MTRVPAEQHWFLKSAVPVVAAILVPVGGHLLSWVLSVSWTLSLKEDIALSVSIVIVGVIFQLKYSLHQIACSLNSFHVDRLKAKHILEVIDKGDYLLLELQARFREIVTKTLNGNPNKVFISYCHRSLEQTLSITKGAARGELEVLDHHFPTINAVLAAFEGCVDRTYRCVWLIEDDEELFDELWREYMACLVELSRKEVMDQRVQVRILFVAENQAMLERPSVKTVLRFVSAEKGFEYHLMSREDYTFRLGDGRLDQSYLDFGVYGDHLLFRTKSYHPNIGVFSDDPMEIKQYCTMHNGAMSAVQTLRIPAELPKNVSLEQFLDCDSADTSSKASVERGAEQ